MNKSRSATITWDTATWIWNNVSCPVYFVIEVIDYTRYRYVFLSSLELIDIFFYLPPVKQDHAKRMQALVAEGRKRKNKERKRQGGNKLNYDDYELDSTQKGGGGGTGNFSNSSSKDGVVFEEGGDDDVDADEGLNLEAHAQARSSSNVNVTAGGEGGGFTAALLEK